MTSNNVIFYFMKSLKEQNLDILAQRQVKLQFLQYYIYYKQTLHDNFTCSDLLNEEENQLNDQEYRAVEVDDNEIKVAEKKKEHFKFRLQKR